MKPYIDLTPNELAQLTHDDVQQYAKRLAMDAGNHPVEHPGDIPPLKYSIAPRHRLHSLQLNWSSVLYDFTFKNQNTALSYRDIFRSMIVTGDLIPVQSCYEGALSGERTTARVPDGVADDNCFTVSAADYYDIGDIPLLDAERAAWAREVELWRSRVTRHDLWKSDLKGYVDAINNTIRIWREHFMRHADLRDKLNKAMAKGWTYDNAVNFLTDVGEPTPLLTHEWERGPTNMDGSEDIVQGKPVVNPWGGQ